MAAQEADQSLAASQDLAAQAGTGGGGATALAAAAAKSKSKLPLILTSRLKQMKCVELKAKCNCKEINSDKVT